jgi:glycosyltransferase involved in cell wall biosynthesis
MPERKVLYVVHTHPAIRPGGAEGYALELYDAMRSSGELEPILLARSGPPQTTAYEHRRSPVTLVGSDPNQYLFETNGGDYEWFFGTSANKVPLTRYYRDFLLAHKPDVVHFQHTLFLGLDIIRVTRNVLPDAAIFYTLHEYLAICYRDGQMVRTVEDQLCLEQSPRRCHECFPAIPTRDFFLRKRFAQTQFEDVDLFISPSRFLRQRYLDWGMSPDKVIWEENGIRLPAQIAPQDEPAGKRNRFGFFGQFTHYKGVIPLLKAMKIVRREDPDVRLWLHGTNLDRQSDDYQRQFNELVDEMPENVVLVGRYDADDLSRLMSAVDYVVVPSLWWENSPRVIQEAFAYGRPVICSGIGGMAEKVTDGVNGFHFRVGDPVSLAATIRKAAEPGTWERLQGNFPPLHTMDVHVGNLTRRYNEVLERRAGSSAAATSKLEQEPVA